MPRRRCGVTAVRETGYTGAMEADSLNPTVERLAMSLTENGAAAAIRIIFQLTTDAELVALYECTDGCRGNPVADILCAELERREIDF
jgi:hypothetical protein